MFKTRLHGAYCLTLEGRPGYRLERYRREPARDAGNNPSNLCNTDLRGVTPASAAGP